MEPDLGGQEKLIDDLVDDNEERVAMEPDLGGQEKSGRPSPHQPSHTGRNGA